MPPLRDPIVLAQIDLVLSNWRYSGYVTAKDLVLEWIAKNLCGYTLRDIAKEMYEYCRRNETISQVPETRPEWSVWPFHYDFRLKIAGRDVYIETILQDDDPKDPTIHIVSIHDV